METPQDPQDARAEIERLRAEIETLKFERRSVADANVRAAAKLVELSEQRRVESEEREHRLQTALQAAEAASHQKDVFLAKVSHELRTPLNGVIGMTTLLLDGALTASQRECAESSLASAQNLLELIQDILDYSKLAATKMALEESEFDLWRIAEEVVRGLSPKAHARGLFIGIALDPAVPRRIKGDALRLRQVLANLVGNAIKFTDDGEVFVRVRAVEGDAESALIRIEVIDTGCGIPRSDFSKLFRAFSQVDDSIRRRHDGTGLGLAISQNIVALMGGDLEVDSEVGIGSRFHFEWRAEVCEPAEPKEQPTGRVALVVNACSMTQRTLDAHFEHVGVRVVHLKSLDALELTLAATKRAPDWVLVEVGEGAHRVRDAALERRCEELSKRTRLAFLEPIDASAPANVVEHLTSLKLPLSPTRLAAWIAGGSLDPVEASSIAKARIALDVDSHRGDLRVLLVEDNRVNQRVAVGLLERLGCEVDVACDGEEAVQKQAAKEYDVVLMDCQMPGVDGFAATRRIRENESRVQAATHTPIIALTAQAMSGDRDRCMESGMDDYLTKPIDPLELAHKLRRWSGVDEA